MKNKPIKKKIMECFENAHCEHKYIVEKKEMEEIEFEWIANKKWIEKGLKKMFNIKNKKKFKKKEETQ